MDFQPAKKKSSCFVRGLSIVVVFDVFSLFRMGISHYRIGTLLVFIELDIELHDE